MMRPTIVAGVGAILACLLSTPSGAQGKPAAQPAAPKASPAAAKPTPAKAVAPKPAAGPKPAAAVRAPAVRAPSPAASVGSPLDADDVDDTTSEPEEGDANAKRPNPGLIAPSLDGLSGLVRVVTGDIGAPHTFRVALHLELLSTSGFLAGRDSHSRFVATLAGNYTPWQYLEIFANARSAANSNERPNDAARVDPEVIFALGDFTFGAKGIYPVHRAFSIGANIGLTFLNSVGGVSIDGDSTSLYTGLIGTFDLAKVSAAPVRFHLNFGYQLDNSDSLSDFSGYRRAELLPSLNVQKFSLGIKPSRLAFKLGVDANLRRWTGIGVTPMLEWAMDISTGDSDPDFNNAAMITPPDNPLAPNDISGRLASWLTFGVRVNPVAGLNVALAVDVGLQSPGFGFGPPVLPWNVILGFSYAYDPLPIIKTVIKRRVRTVVRKVEPALGKLRGRVIDAKTLEPIEGAIITFPGRDLTGLSTDPDGGFLSYGFKPGSVHIMVRHPRYKPNRGTGKVSVGGETKVDVKLTPLAPKVGKLIGSVVDLRNNGVAATIRLTGPQNLKLTASPSGAFDAKLKPGDYQLKVEADGFLRKEGRLSIAAGGTANVAFVISPKPRRSLVRVTKKAIIIRRKVHFATGTADIKEDSRQLLDQIADVLLSNPRIRVVEIQGHTDNRGSRARNLTLSQARAEAVRDHLVRAGVQPARLQAKGYGPSRPKRPNITRRNRAMNRRVEFKIPR